MKKCKHGHASGFYADGRCKACCAISRKKYYQKTAEKQREYAKEWRKANPNYANIWREENLEKERTRRRQRYLDDPLAAKRSAIKWREQNQARHAANRVAWKTANKEKLREYEARRRAAKNSGTPEWANLGAILEFYKNCPEGYEVDHIIPLNSPLVCGLHVETNLQYLTKAANASKGNRFDDHPE